MVKIILCNSDATGFLSDCPSLMLGNSIRCIQHSQIMLERGVCELAHSFFLFLRISNTPSSPCWYTPIERWLRVNQVYYIWVKSLCILLVSILLAITLMRHRPCWCSEVGEEQRFWILSISPWPLLKKTLLDNSFRPFSFSDEEKSTSVEQLAPLHHTWGANIWKSKKCHHFFIQKGTQGIIDTLKSVKK